MKTIQTKKIVLTALFTALITVATLFIRVPLPLGYVNLGDAFILLSVFILGPRCGTIASATGSAIADLIGYAAYAPGTLIIKGLMALTASLIYTAIYSAAKKSLLAEIVAGIVGALIMTFGYFLYETLLFTTAAVAIINIPYNLIQGGLGVAIAAAAMRVLIPTKIIEKLNGDVKEKNN